MGELAFRLRQVRLRAASGAEILGGVDWQLGRGGVGLVVGASGSGKSRLLRLLNRLDEPSGGELEVLGRPLADWPVGELRRRVGWVPQRPSLGSGTGRDALEVVLRVHALARPELDARLPAALELVALSEPVIDRQVSQLSGGERHRVAVARALLLEPELLLLDEPSGALDGSSALALLQALGQWRARGQRTVVVVTHRIEDVRLLGGDLLALAGGKVVRAGAAAEVLADPAGFDVRGLLTGREVGREA